MVEELNTAGTATAQYAQGSGIDEPLATSRGGTLAFYESDGLGSVTSLTNNTGSALAAYTRDTFGNPVSTADSAVNNPFRYTGRDYDSETGLYYYRARYYNPQAGRFLQEDPLRFAAGANFYAYVRGNPTNASDPSGLWSPEAHDKIIAHALAGCARPCDIARLQRASRDFDRRTGGAVSFSPLHSMKAPWQDPDTALRIRDRFIDATVAQASAAEQAGIHGQAMDLLAYAIHPVMDSTSLIHMEHGKPLTWNGLHSVDDYFHSPADWWGDETSDMLAFGSPRFNDMEARIRSYYIRVMGGCTAGH